MSPAQAAVTLPDRPVLGVKEVASILGVNVKTLYAEINAGRFPAIRMGRRMRISRAVVVSMLEQGRAPPTEPTPQLGRPSRGRRGR